VRGCGLLLALRRDCGLNCHFEQVASELLERSAWFCHESPCRQVGAQRCPIDVVHFFAFVDLGEQTNAPVALQGDESSLQVSDALRESKPCCCGRLCGRRVARGAASYAAASIAPPRNMPA